MWSCEATGAPLPYMYVCVCVYVWEGEGVQMYVFMRRLSSLFSHLLSKFLGMGENLHTHTHRAKKIGDVITTNIKINDSHSPILPFPYLPPFASDESSEWLGMESGLGKPQAPVHGVCGEFESFLSDVVLSVLL